MSIFGCILFIRDDGFEEYQNEIACELINDSFLIRCEMAIYLTVSIFIAAINTEITAINNFDRWEDVLIDLLYIHHQGTK